MSIPPPHPVAHSQEQLQLGDSVTISILVLLWGLIEMSITKFLY